MTTQTKGFYRVSCGSLGAADHSNEAALKNIEAKAAALIDAIEQGVPMEAAESTTKAHQQAEKARLKALAQTAAEEAAMWAAKAVLKPVPLA